MKQVQNQGLRITGIILCMAGLALIARPLAALLLGRPSRISFFKPVL